MNAAPQTPTETTARFWRCLSLALFLVVTLIGCFTVSDYGRSWDETFRFGGGDAKLAYYKTLFSGESPAALTDSYPGLFDLPHSYVPYWMWRTIPEHVLLLFGIALIAGLYGLIRNRKNLAPRILAAALLLFSSVFPVLYILWRDPVLYDGMRHTLFVLPPLVCVAALGLEWGLRQLRLFWQRLAQSVLAALFYLCALG